VPGDSIFGFITVGEGVMIHRTTCPNATRLMSQYGYRIIPAEWRGDGYQKAFETAIGVRGIDEVGIVSRITDIISKDMEVNMKSINISSNQDGTFGGKIEVMIYDLLHLEQLITKIKATHKYIQVTRED
jgi:GTP pyrophosphokinase